MNLHCDVGDKIKKIDIYHCFYLPFFYKRKKSVEMNEYLNEELISIFFFRSFNNRDWFLREINSPRIVICRELTNNGGSYLT